jgi:hypothetical protein
MDARYMQEAVEIELSQYDPDYELKNKLESRQIFYYLSRSERDYVQEIYNSGVDKNEENKKKLGSLLLTTTISGGNIASNSFYPSAYTISLPSELLYVINERAITSDESNIYIKPISYDEYNTNKDNPFRKARIDKYLRLEGADQHIILTPNTTLTGVKIDYIKTPSGIDLNQNCELHESVHYNIVKGAVKLIMAAKQNQIGYSIQSKEEKENK